MGRNNNDAVQPAALALAALIFAGSASPAYAHVKWFCGPVDIARPPLDFASVMSPLFAVALVGFLIALIGGSALDGVIVNYLPKLALAASRTGRFEPILIRIGVAGYCVCLWDKAAVAPWGSGRAILTPELFATSSWLGIWQLAIAVLLISRRTVPAAALGLLGLYGLGVIRYDLFHMIDYVYFLGIVGYLIIAYGGEHTRRWNRWKIPALCLTMSFSLIWTAVEKLLYPEWTIAVLLTHPAITLGLQPPLVAIIASFVESTLAFYLSVGRGLLRLASAVLMMVFISAIPEFGMLDTVGHLPIIAVFCVICLHGPTWWHHRFAPWHHMQTRNNTFPTQAASIAAHAVATGLLYLGTLAVVTALYYALHHTTTWPFLAGSTSLQT